MKFKDKVKLYVKINEEMADKLSAELEMLIKNLKPVYKSGTVLKIQEYANKIKKMSDELRTNNAYRNLVLKADSLRNEMIEFIKNK